MTLNANQKQKFRNQEDFMLELGFVEGVREVTSKMRLFPFNYGAIPGLEDRTVDFYNELPNPSGVDEGKYWMVINETPFNTNGLYEVIDGNWKEVDEINFFTNMVPDKFRNDRADLYDAEVLQEWLEDRGFQMNLDPKWTYDSGIVSKSIIKPTRAEAMEEIQNYFIDDEDGADTVDDLLEIMFDTETPDGTQTQIPKYLDIDQEYMFVKEDANLKNFVDTSSLVEDLRYKELVFIDEELDVTSTKFYNMLVYSGLERSVYNLENDLQEIILEDDSNRQIMQDVYDDVEELKNLVDDMYDDANVKHSNSYNDVIDITPTGTPIAPFEADSHEGYHVAYYDGSSFSPPPDDYILIKTNYKMEGSSILEIIDSLRIITEDDTVVTLSDISSSNIELVTNDNNINFRMIKIYPSDAIWTSDWYPATVDITYRVSIELKDWPTVKPPSVFVLDSSDARLGYRFIKESDIYTPEKHIDYSDGFDAIWGTDNDKEYLDSEPYDKKVDVWKVETELYNGEFINNGTDSNKVYFYATNNVSDQVVDGDGWSASNPDPTEYTDLNEFLNTVYSIFAEDHVNRIFNNAKKERENPIDTTIYNDDTGNTEEAKRPSGLRAELLGMCSDFSGNLVNNRKNLLDKKQYYDDVVNYME